MLHITNISTEPHCDECETAPLPVKLKDMNEVNTYRSILINRYKLREVFFTIKQLINENSDDHLR